MIVRELSEIMRLTDRQKLNINKVKEKKLVEKGVYNIMFTIMRGVCL